MKKILFTLMLLSPMATFGNEAEQNDGKMLYQKACVQCHSPMRAKSIGAPAAFDVPMWNKRFAHAKKEVAKWPERFDNEMDYLVHQIQIGKGLMQHGGLCVESGVKPELCVDKTYRDAILYMRSKKPNND